MGRLTLGMKIYTTDWHTWYGLDYDEACDQLRDLGVRFALTLNTRDPAPLSGLPSRVAPEYRDRVATYSDDRLRAALEARGIAYHAGVSIFYDPARWERDPGIRPVDALGHSMAPNGWYRGLCPSNEAYVQERLDAIRRAIRQLDPDGVFLMMIRFPGHWERWVAGYQRGLADETCFCPRCLERFQSDTGLSIMDRERPGLTILNEHRPRWTAWKCSLIADIVRRARAIVEAAKPGTPVMLNMVPFRRADFGEAGREVFAQDLEQLAPVADAFEIMTYHQVIKRPPPFITAIATEFVQRTHRPVYCTVFSRPRYLDGVYQADGRAPAITADEVGAILDAVAASPATGVLFRWEDYLQDLRDPSPAARRTIERTLDQVLATS
jgi:hypothetical protein